MAKGKHQRVPKHYRKSNKVVPVLLSVVLLLSLAAGATIAFISTKSTQVENEFIPASVVSSVNDDGTVNNDGNVDAYIRAAVVVNWMDRDGNVYGIKPSYTVAINSGWSKSGDFYYYTSAVAANKATATSPVTVTLSDGQEAPSDYSLSIEIVAEAIQAEGTLDSDDSTTAVFDAWGLTPGGN